MYRQLLFFILVLISTGSGLLYGQSRGVNRDKYRIHIIRTGEKMTIDGILDEKPWMTAERTGKFTRVTPTDTGYAIAQTEVMLTYDDMNLYVGVICHDPRPGKRPVESLRRDYNFMKNDNFMLFLDTYNDQTNGFAFGISAAGAQTEGLQYDGTKVSYSWDIKWRSAVKSFDDSWVIEISIPFRSIRYAGGDTEWGVNFGRLDLKNNEKSAWAPVPRQFPHCSLPFTGTLVWDKPMDKAGLRISFIPYLTAKATQNKLPPPEKSSRRANAGFDAKMILSTSMNLDLTVNPDYSQVEVDKQQTNLDRFELFFPEKRQFFLENSDLFSNLGSETIRPFFSRRIGLDNPVRAGLRLSGNLTDKWRINLMDIQTGVKDTIHASNFMVAALQRSVFSRSNISAFLINKQVMGVKSDSAFSGSRFNRIAGLEYNLASPDNRWTGKTFYHQGIGSSMSVKDAAMAAFFTYSSQYLTATLNQSVVGERYTAETGYIRRKGYYELNPVIQYKFFPKSKTIVSHGPGVKMDMFFDPAFSLTDRETQLLYSIEWTNKNTGSVDVKETFIKLQFPYDPTNTGGTKFNKGEYFNWKEIGAAYASDPRKQFNVALTARYGGYYTGSRLTLNGEFNYRVQPIGNFALSATYNNIVLPAPYKSAGLLLIGPRLDFTFTDKLFFTSYIQYNNQVDNLNLNLRFQWRFAPVSDLFIVYTENSIPGNYSVKNRGIVVKLSYWFN